MILSIRSTKTRARAFTESEYLQNKHYTDMSKKSTNADTDRPPAKKRALEKIRPTNIAETMNECLWVGDENRKTIYVNPVFEKISEYSFKECIGKDCDFWFDKQSKKTITEHHGLRKKGKSSQYEATLISKSGKRIPLLISGSPTVTGGTIGVFTNLTIVKKLAAQEYVFEEVIKNSTEAIVILDKKRRIKLWNTGAQKIFEYKKEEMLNKNLKTIIPKEDWKLDKEMIQEVEEKNYIRNIEARKMAKSGKMIDVSISVTKVVDENKKFIGYLVIYRDISPLKKSNKELQKRFEAIQDAYKQLGIQKRQYDYIDEICSTAASKDSLAHLEKLIISAAHMLTKCDAAVLRLYDKKTDALILKSCLGVDQKWLGKSKIKYGNSLTKDAMDKRRPLIIENVDSLARHQSIKLLKSHKFTTLILLPLLTSNKIIGSISLYSTDPAKFRLIETDFLEKFSAHTSIALATKLR